MTAETAEHQDQATSDRDAVDAELPEATPCWSQPLASDFQLLLYAIPGYGITACPPPDPRPFLQQPFTKTPFA